MDKTPAELEQVGLVVTSLGDKTAYAGRARRTRDGLHSIEALQRLALAFVEQPATILQELVESAVRVCGADSAGISVEREQPTDDDYYEWVATAGVYSPFLHASLPVYPSACSVCLTRGQPQLFRVSKRFFDILGVEAEPVNDGILLPWEVEGTRGTIFVIAHQRTEAFDVEDLRIMRILSNFAAMGVRQQRQQARLIQQSRSAGRIAMADELAHKINNPLQAMTNTLYLARHDAEAGDARTLATQLEPDFDRLSTLVKRLLELPYQSSIAEGKAEAKPEAEGKADTTDTPAIGTKAKSADTRNRAAEPATR